LAVFATFALLCLSAYGQQPTRNPKIEQTICGKLAATAPQAVDPFQRATAAMDAGNYQEAAALYRQVLQQAPLFTPAMRRLGASLAGSGQIDEGLTYNQQAVKIERTPENLASLAQLLAFPAPDHPGSASQLQDAFRLAREACDNYSGEDDASYFLLYAQLALMVRDESEFRRATQTLVRTHPELIATHYFNAVRLAMDENWIGSEDEIKTAERMGFPKERGEAFLSAGIRRRAIISRCLHYAPYVIGAWLLGLAALFLIGKILSGLTLRLIENADPSSSLSRTEMILRSFYRRLITVAGSFLLRLPSICDCVGFGASRRRRVCSLDDGLYPDQAGGDPCTRRGHNCVQDGADGFCAC